MRISRMLQRIETRGRFPSSLQNSKEADSLQNQAVPHVCLSQREKRSHLNDPAHDEQLTHSRIIHPAFLLDNRESGSFQMQDSCSYQNRDKQWDCQFCYQEICKARIASSLQTMDTSNSRTGNHETCICSSQDRDNDRKAV